MHLQILSVCQNSWIATNLIGPHFCHSHVCMTILSLSQTCPCNMPSLPCVYLPLGKTTLHQHNSSIQSASSQHCILPIAAGNLTGSGHMGSSLLAGSGTGYTWIQDADAGTVLQCHKVLTALQPVLLDHNSNSPCLRDAHPVVPVSHHSSPAYHMMCIQSRHRLGFDALPTATFTLLLLVHE